MSKIIKRLHPEVIQKTATRCRKRGDDSDGAGEGFRGRVAETGEGLTRISQIRSASQCH
jgi:hypothetical protein